MRPCLRAWLGPLFRFTLRTINVRVGPSHNQHWNTGPQSKTYQWIDQVSAYQSITLAMDFVVGTAALAVWNSLALASAVGDFVPQESTETINY